MEELTKEQKRISWHYRRIAWKHFYPEGNGKAKKGWCLHHKDETLRERDIDRYIQWRIEDLVVMERGEHQSLHHKGRVMPDEIREKHRQAMLGRSLSEETKRKLSEAHKGKLNPHDGHPQSEITRRKIGEAFKVKYWWNNGVVCIRAKECPDGFVAGRIKPSHK